MCGRTQVRADVERHCDLLSAGLVERKVLDPSNGRTRIPGESRRVHREILSEVEISHVVRCSSVILARKTVPIAVRGYRSIPTTPGGDVQCDEQSRVYAMSCSS